MRSTKEVVLFSAQSYVSTPPPPQKKNVTYYSYNLNTIDYIISTTSNILVTTFR